MFFIHEDIIAHLSAMDVKRLLSFLSQNICDNLLQTSIRFRIIRSTHCVSRTMGYVNGFMGSNKPVSRIKRDEQGSLGSFLRDRLSLNLEFQNKDSQRKCWPFLCQTELRP